MFKGFDRKSWSDKHVEVNKRKHMPLTSELLNSQQLAAWLYGLHCCPVGPPLEVYWHFCYCLVDLHEIPVETYISNDPVCFFYAATSRLKCSLIHWNISSCSRWIDKKNPTDLCWFPFPLVLMWIWVKCLHDYWIVAFTCSAASTVSVY